MAIGTMTRGEKAVVFVSNAYLTESPLMNITEDLEGVQFEVELVHFIQVHLPFIYNAILLFPNCLHCNLRYALEVFQ